ncbi:MAG: hypothetical protein PVJ75_09630 [Chloroflexota bacterium]
MSRYCKDAVFVGRPDQGRGEWAFLERFLGLIDRWRIESWVARGFAGSLLLRKT